MKTYLIFFGKSQSFNFYAFDINEGYVANFDTVIKDFDLLESKVFTVDDVDNKDILAKYNFTKQDENFSLIKLYSFAQAFNGDRIAGSIYGVALLSDRELPISGGTLTILTNAKKLFARLSLNSGMKFNTSDFKNDAVKIWQTLQENDVFGEKYLPGIKKKPFVLEQYIPQAFYVDKLIGATELNDKIKETSRMYFSEDWLHLERTHERSGNKLLIYYKKEDAFVPMEEEEEEPEPQSGLKPIDAVKQQIRELDDIIFYVSSNIGNYDNKQRMLKILNEVIGEKKDLVEKLERIETNWFLRTGKKILVTAALLIAALAIGFLAYQHITRRTIAVKDKDSTRIEVELQKTNVENPVEINDHADNR